MVLLITTLHFQLCSYLSLSTCYRMLGTPVCQINAWWGALSLCNPTPYPFHRGHYSSTNTTSYSHHQFLLIFLSNVYACSIILKLPVFLIHRCGSLSSCILCYRLCHLHRPEAISHINLYQLFQYHNFGRTTGSVMFMLLFFFGSCILR